MQHAHTPSPLTRRRLLGSIASAAGLFALAGCATDALAYRGLASLELFDRDAGQVIALYANGGRQFAPGRPGARYALRLRNLSDARVLVVLSVDGVNVISGQTADWRQVGYVLSPGQSYDISGWRKSDTEIAAFEFAPIARSYATLTGRPGNVGVIGMAVFRERPLPPQLQPQLQAPPPPASPLQSPAPPAALRSDKSAGSLNEAGSAAAPERRRDELSADSKLGTGHGQREWSVTTRTSFERASATPDQLIQIEYDSFDRLLAAGIIPRPQLIARPQPFPSNPVGYVPDPPQRY